MRDLRALMMRELAIAWKVLAVARERAGGALDNLTGDLIAAELQDSDQSKA